jgi:hypothetical protein
MLKNHGYLPPQVTQSSAVSGAYLAIDPHFARARRRQPINASKKCRLPGARRPKNCEELPWAHVEVNVA